MKKLTTQEIKEIELEILKKIDEFCRNHEITYFLAYGTLLGAIRHKGFIPWDDDIDIQMPRQDYERFIELFKKENEKSRYRVVAPFDKDSKHTYVKVVDERTIKKEKGILYKNGFLGIDVDVFPIDGQPSDLKKFEKWYNKKYRLYRFDRTSITDPKTLSLTKRILRPIINLLGAKKRYLKKAEKMLKAYPYETSEYVGSTAGLSNSKKNRYSKCCFEKAIEVPFEQFMFKAPVGYDEILTAMYGDYMTPPQSKQSTHTNECYLKNEGER